jgi:hypothetical protein
MGLLGMESGQQAVNSDSLVPSKSCNCVSRLVMRIEGKGMKRYTMITSFYRRHLIGALRYGPVRFLTGPVRNRMPGGVGTERKNRPITGLAENTVSPT